MSQTIEPHAGPEREPAPPVDPLELSAEAVDAPGSERAAADAPDPEPGVADADAQRQAIIDRLTQVEDTAALLKIKLAIDRLDAAAQRDEYDALLTRILEGEGGEDAPLSTRQALPEEPAVVRFEKRVAPWMFYLSCASLVSLGLILMIVPDDQIPLSAGLLWTLFGTGGALGLVFVVELAVVAYLLKRDKLEARPGYMRRRLLMVLFPPARLGLHHIADPDLIWVPRWRWSRTNHAMFEELRRRFSAPMILIALLIVPILLLEWKLFDAAAGVFPGGALALHSTLQVFQALIWAAFAFEFFLMVSIAEDKVDYCKRSWLDILIILLPLISFFRSARVLRAARLNQLARGYRLKGVLLKARQALVLADAIQRLIFPNPEKQALAIARKMKQNRRDRAELERLALMAVERIKVKRAREEERARERGAQRWWRRGKRAASSPPSPSAASSPPSPSAASSASAASSPSAPPPQP